MTTLSFYNVWIFNFIKYLFIYWDNWIISVFSFWCGISYELAMDRSEAHRHRWTTQKHCLEELPFAWDQGQQPRGATPHPRSGVAAEMSNPRQKSGGCPGAGEPRGATERSRTGGVAKRWYPSSKVRSSGCALLEQPWRDTPRPR